MGETVGMSFQIDMYMFHWLKKNGKSSDFCYLFPSHFNENGSLIKTKFATLF